MPEQDWKKVEQTNNDTWDFESQEEIVGVYVKAKENVGPNKSMFYTLRTKDGEIGVWGSTILDDRFSGITLGEEVRIVYLGRKPSTNPGVKPYHTYDVFHRPVGKDVTPIAKVADSSEVKVEDISF